MDKSSHRGWQMHSNDMISWIMIQMYAEMEYMRCWLELVKFTIKMTNNVSSLASAVTSTIHYYKILAPNGQIFSSYIATDSGIFDDIPAMLWVQQPSYLISNHGIVWIFGSKWNLNGSCYWPVHHHQEDPSNDKDDPMRKHCCADETFIGPSHTN